MITDRAAYVRLCEQEQWDALRAMSLDDSIVVLEALLSSEVEDIAVFADDDCPMSLARSLGIPPGRVHDAAIRKASIQNTTVTDVIRSALRKDLGMR